jgi:hypothetical protein
MPSARSPSPSFSSPSDLAGSTEPSHDAGSDAVEGRVTRQRDERVLGSEFRL